MERRVSLKKYDYVTGLLDRRDPTSARQGVLIELLDETTGVVVHDLSDELNKTWTLYDIDDTVVNPKMLNNETKQLIKRLKKLSFS